MPPGSAVLTGRTILVTRAVHQAQCTVNAVKNRGGNALLLPCLEVEYHPEAVDQTLQALFQNNEADVLITSCNGIDSLLAQCAASDLRQLIGGQRRVVAVGRQTAESLQYIGVSNVITPEDFSQQGVAMWWNQHGWPQQLIFVRAAQGRDDLLPQLHEHGCVIRLFACYGSRVPSQPPPTAIVQQLQWGHVDAVVLGSSATARGLIARVGIDLARRPIAAAISRRVAEESKQLGLRVQVVAVQASFDAMLDQLGHHFGGTP